MKSRPNFAPKRELIRRRIAGWERLFRRFVNRARLFLQNFSFGAEPIVHRRAWTIAALPINFLSPQADSVSAGKRLCRPSCINSWHKICPPDDHPSTGRTRFKGALSGSTNPVILCRTSAIECSDGGRFNRTTVKWSRSSGATIQHQWRYPECSNAVERMARWALSHR